MQTSGDDSQPLIALRTVFWLVAAAATLNLLSYARSVSHLHVYRDLQLGMPRSEAMQVLRAQSIDCGSLSSASYPKGSPPESVGSRTSGESIDWFSVWEAMAASL
jgi:hypothetical protein